MRHDDRRRLFGLTWIGWLNLLGLQWVGLRLAAVVAPPDDTHVGWAVCGRLPVSGWRWPYKAVSVAWLAAVVAAWAL
jgi:hypothetical protein